MSADYDPQLRNLSNSEIVNYIDNHPCDNPIVAELARRILSMSEALEELEYRSQLLSKIEKLLEEEK